MMNSNMLQTLLTVLIAISTVATTALLNVAGCVQAATGIDCTTSHAPTWMVPYLVAGAGVLGIVKLVIGAMTGKLVAPTVPVSATGKTGTVTKDQIRK